MIQQLGYVRGTDGMFRDAAGELLTVQIQATNEAQNTKPSLTIADYWKRIGVAAEVEVVPIQLQNDRRYRATFPGLNLQGSSSGIQRIGELQSAQARTSENNFTGRNYPRYMNPDFDVMVKSLFATIPVAPRTQALQGVIQHMTDQVVMYSLFYAVTPSMISNRMANVGFYPSWNTHEWDVN